MDSFQKTVLGISVFLLVVILVIITIMMLMTNSKAVFPPIQQSCPSGWNSDSSGNCYFVGKNGGKAILPNGTQNMDTGKLVNTEYPIYFANNNNGVLSFNSGKYPSGIPSNPPINKSITNTVVFNPNDPAWTSKGGKAICAHQKFANNYNIYWDGVSNTNQCSSTS